MLKRFAFTFSGFSLFVGNLNSNKDFDEIKATLRKFFSKNDLEIADIRLGNSRYGLLLRFWCVDFLFASVLHH